MIFVTPDGERSMNTYLGACLKLSAKDIDHDLVAASKITYFEGYLWDPEDAKDAIRAAAQFAHEAGPQGSHDAFRCIPVWTVTVASFSN